MKKKTVIADYREPEFYILWNPLSDRPPTVRISTRKEAERIAASMASRFGPQPFYICKAVGVSRVTYAPPETSKLRKNSR